MAFNKDLDYASQLKKAITAGASVQDVGNLLNERVEKSNNTPGLSQYAYDDVYKMANDYIKNNTPPPQQDNTSLINQMFADQQAAQAAKIKAATDRQVSDYNQQIGEAPQKYQPLRNEASLNGAVQANQIKEVMAAGGQGVSGKNLSAESANSASTSGQIAGYNLQEQNLVNSLKKAISDAQAAGDAETLASNATINANRIQSIINETNRQQDTANSNYWNGKNYNLQVGNALGSINGQDTLEKKKMDSDNAYRDKVFDYNKEIDARNFTYQQMQDNINNALKAGQLSISEANLALQKAKFAADQDPNSLDNQMKRQQLDSTTLGNAIGRLDSLYTYKDSDTGQITRNPDYSDAQLRAAIIGLGLPDNQTDALLLRYGLSVN